MSLVLPGIQSSSVSTQATCTCRSCKLELFLRATAMGGRNILSKMFCSLFMLDSWVWYNGWLVGYGTVVLRRLERSRDCWKLFSMLIGKPCEPIIMKHYQEPMKTVTKINEWFQPNFFLFDTCLACKHLLKPSNFWCQIKLTRQATMTMKQLTVLIGSLAALLGDDCLGAFQFSNNIRNSLDRKNKTKDKKN